MYIVWNIESNCFSQTSKFHHHCTLTQSPRYFYLYNFIYLFPDILTNIASASDADIITDFDTTTQLTISQTHLIHWRMAFELVQTQTSPFFVYIYGSENLCTHPNVLLGVFLVFDGSGDCTGDRTFEPCLFDQYNSGDHVSGVCVYRCQCATSCTDVLVNLQPVRSPTVHTISDISWQPV